MMSMSSNIAIDLVEIAYMPIPICCLSMEDQSIMVKYFFHETFSKDTAACNTSLKDCFYRVHFTF